jgi:hypothetical protein
MAEIRVQTKKQTSIWPWVLIALVVIGALIYFMTRNKENNAVDADHQTNTSTGYIAAPQNAWSVGLYSVG